MKVLRCGIIHITHLLFGCIFNHLLGPDGYRDTLRRKCQTETHVQGYKLNFQRSLKEVVKSVQQYYLVFKMLIMNRVGFNAFEPKV